MIATDRSFRRAEVTWRLGLLASVCALAVLAMDTPSSGAERAAKSKIGDPRPDLDPGLARRGRAAPALSSKASAKRDLRPFSGRNLVGGDTCASATDLATMGFVCDGTWFVDPAMGIPGATASNGPAGSCWFEGDPVDNDVWYSWTNTTGGLMTIDVSTEHPSNSAGDSQIAVYSDCVGSIELACDDDGGDEYLSIVGPVFVLPGQTIYIQFDGYGGDIDFDVGQFYCDVAPPPGVTRGPYLQTGTPTALTVRWRSDILEDAQLRIGLDPSSLSVSFTNPSIALDHAVTATGLTPDTRYYYSVGPTTGALVGGDGDHTFLTAPLSGTAKPSRFWVLGDSGTANVDANRVRNAYVGYLGNRHTDGMLMLGDNAYDDGTDAEYQSALFNMYPTILRKTVLWSTYGNHDGHSADSGSQTGVYYNVFTLPRNGDAGGVASGTEAYYSFDYGNIHFICLDSFESDRVAPSPMIDWLQLDLLATSADWVIAFWHHPPYSNGSHDSDVDVELIEMRENLVPLLESAGVDLVLSGHSHSYERSWFIDGFYGDSSSWNPSAMLVDGGDGRDDGTGAYQKPAGGPTPHAGVTYVVSGSSGRIEGVSNRVPFLVSENRLGSVVLEVACGRLDARFIDDVGVVRDHFSIFKGAVGPTAPESLRVTAITHDRVDLSWTDASLLETSVQLERSDDGGLTFFLLATLPANTTTYADTPLPPGTIYVYRARATNPSCSSLWSNTVAATTTGQSTGCGNGVVEAGEACDSFNENTSMCDLDCTLPQCGDGVFNVAAGEECDDGNTQGADGCDGLCRIEGCVSGNLSVVRLLMGVKVGSAASFEWQDDPAAGEYHLNSVLSKSELTDPRRGLGNGIPECDTTTTACVDLDAPTTGYLFYQVLSACSAAVEGPY